MITGMAHVWLSDSFDGASIVLPKRINRDLGSGPPTILIRTLKACRTSNVQGTLQTSQVPREEASSPFLIYRRNEDHQPNIGSQSDCASIKEVEILNFDRQIIQL